MFYTFDQFNRNGYFKFDYTAGIYAFVIIEADTAKQANKRAGEIGIDFEEYYFPSGFRWYRREESEGKDVPYIYEKKIQDVVWDKDFMMEVYLDDDPSKIACVHFQDGSMKWYGMRRRP